MKSDKFTATYEQVKGFSAFKVLLTCPSCGHKYPLVHEFCGQPLEPEDALVTRKCSACIDNGQEPSARISDGVADCPNCGKQCRYKKDIHDSFSGTLSTTRHDRRRKLPETARKSVARQRCEVCGFERGLEYHHKDWDKNNNRVGNLQVLCKWCHVQSHKLGMVVFQELIRRVGSDDELKEALRNKAEKFFKDCQIKTSTKEAN